MEEKQSMEENYSVAGEGFHVVRNHKDTVFRMIYKDRTKLLELYNALNGTDYEDAAELEVCTLEMRFIWG